MDDLFLRAAIGAAALGAAAGAIGCFVLWRRMAYLGTSIAELALLGVALGLIVGIDPLLGVLLTSLAAALILARPWSRFGRQGQGVIPVDTRIGLVGHAGLALGFVLLTALEDVRADLLGYLFGDVLALTYLDIAWISGFSVLALVTLAWIWRPLLADTLSPEILVAEEGAPSGARAQAIFLVLVAALIAFGVRVVGALLIVALLLIPAAVARPLVRTPEAMAFLAAGVGILVAPLGLLLAFALDFPAGPSIVLAAAVLFVCSTAAAALLQRS